MDKRLTYQAGNWLLAISLAISFYGYTGYASFVETCQPQPQQVEWVYSDQNYTDNETISVDQYFAPDLSQEPVKRSREYEALIQEVHQNRIIVTLRAVSEQFVYYSPPFVYRHITTIPHSTEESTSDISG